MNGFYQNSGYVNNRNRKQILILDVDDSASGDTHLGTGGEFNIPLFEPLIIDSLSEVYLDNFISFNSNISNITANSAFVLRINEFNINSNVASSSNNNTIFNSIVIPNEHSTVADNHGVVLHKAKKFNYICDINPGKISNISGKITNLAGEPMFHSNDSTYKFTYTLSGILKYSSDTKGVISSSDTATITETESTLTLTGATTCKFLAGHNAKSDSLHFATDLELGTLDASNTGTIIFTFDGGKELIINHNPTSNNPSLFLTQNDARFVAEFSINSRE
tara:strand:+ start:1585 stop:2418 length:834 start_codon:yes stop_codon:yes gene_type:complete